MQLITAIKLSQLFSDNQRKGQEIFPELMKRLVIAIASVKSFRLDYSQAKGQ